MKRTMPACFLLLCNFALYTILSGCASSDAIEAGTDCDEQCPVGAQRISAKAASGSCGGDGSFNPVDSSVSGGGTCVGSGECQVVCLYPDCSDGQTLVITETEFRCEASDEADPCKDVTCSGHGRCRNNNGQAQCVCDEGYYDDGLECIASADGDQTDGDDPIEDGDTPDGDEPDGDEEEDCTSEASSACFQDDLYWYDSCGNREGVKEECGNAGCEEGTCRVFTCNEETCLDPVTGFTWQKTPGNDNRTWDDASNYCATLSLGSYQDWRLPNISELRTLVHGCYDIESNGTCEIRDYCVPCGDTIQDQCLESTCRNSDLCNPSACTDEEGPNGCYWQNGLEGTCNLYWSTSIVEDNQQYVWLVHFDDALLNLAKKDSATKQFYRCVRGGS